MFYGEWYNIRFLYQVPYLFEVSDAPVRLLMVSGFKSFGYDVCVHNVLITMFLAEQIHE